MQRVIGGADGERGLRRSAIAIAATLVAVALVAALSPGLPDRVRASAAGISLHALLGDAAAVVLAGTLALVAWALYDRQPRRTRPGASASRARRRRPVRPPLDLGALLPLLAILAATALALGLVALLGTSAPLRGAGAPGAAGAVGATPHAVAPRSGGGVPVNDLLLVILAGVVVLASAVVAVRSYRRRVPTAAELTADAALVAAVEESLEELAREPDPRRAVIRAYARMETALERGGVGRGRAETPLEFLRRALEAVHASRPSIVRLTDLFERARFSSHRIDGAMKDEAIGALGALRAELSDAGQAP